MKNTYIKKSILAALLAALLAGCASTGGTPGSPHPAPGPDGLLALTAAYPEPTAPDMTAQQFIESDDYGEWRSASLEKLRAAEKVSGRLDGYYAAIMAELLPSENKNTVCSPLNTFIAFAMLAEVTDGNSRQQILDALGISDMDELRSTVTSLWESNYADTPVVKSLLANSFWLRNSVTFNEDTLARLASDYYASSFSGEPGSAAMDEALRKWTDDNTGGLLTDYTKDMHLDAATVLALVSTLYYKAEWVDHFNQNATAPETFHGADGDTIVDMMHMTDITGVFSTDTFTSVGLSLMDSGTMYFFLPNENTPVSALASDPDLLAATRRSEDPRWRYPMVNLSVPKFSVSAKTDLLETIADLGITDVLDPGISDFTPLTEDVGSLFLSQAEHAALVEVDEDGVTGAAYTLFALAEGAAEPPKEQVDFVLDRPFLFLVTSRDGSVLFSGVVNNI